jgi:hypothetical protein
VQDLNNSPYNFNLLSQYHIFFVIVSLTHVTSGLIAVPVPVPVPGTSKDGCEFSYDKHTSRDPESALCIFSFFNCT